MSCDHRLEDSACLCKFGGATFSLSSLHRDSHGVKSSLGMNDGGPVSTQANPTSPPNISSRISPTIFLQQDGGEKPGRSAKEINDPF